MSSNRLKNETSPYLLQHANNPVHWYAWEEAAFEEARRLKRPVLLSIGYAACHWCHVMAHESFEDESTAQLMNDNFINIKVDREERPDIDRIYMKALHSLGEQGGWPLTMFLTPDAKPFWGGTYFPREDLYGRPSFKKLLQEIIRAWHDEPDIVEQNALAITARLSNSYATDSKIAINGEALHGAAQAIMRLTDPVYGGLQGAPKFPQTSIFQFLWGTYLRQGGPGLRDCVHTTLGWLSNAGIYDHLAGGIARYATDVKWHVPHFEKMLYDNAQYLDLLANVHISNPSQLYHERLLETWSYLKDEKRTSDGLYTSSFDADSEGEEGKYTTWSYQEIVEQLPAEWLPLFTQTYDVKKEGNWQDVNILDRSQNPFQELTEQEKHLKECRDLLLTVRKTRIPPLHDTKILADWNGLAITACCKAALALHDHNIWQEQEISYQNLVSLLWKNDRLFHSYHIGQTRHWATADDYANLIEAALWLYALSTKSDYLISAEQLYEATEKYHWQEQNSGFTLASHDTKILTNQPFLEDDATPNANATMLGNLTRLFYLTDKPRYLTKAQSLIKRFSSEALQNPVSATSFLHTASLALDSIKIDFEGKDPLTSSLLYKALYFTGLNIILQTSQNDQPDRLIICRNMVCSAPVKNTAELEEALIQLGLKPS